ncbi:DUF485 domain-containing protein [Rhizobium sullae]|uniref:DUF485 domain-containing protein n=1 Tax=Rhizobium sullae TaxID=50338 RepID=A0A2N0D073_RHISU|nr:DUF485 domain-containing protein [Rhizobium sullae]PKA39511.1 DUF485 domain-containing protein [Rhizobium sullae]
MSRIQNLSRNLTFRRLCFERNLVGLSLAALMAMTYFAFILTVAFEPEVLGMPIHANSVISWGVLIGVGILCFGFALTAVYVVFANTRLDRLTHRFHEEVR